MRLNRFREKAMQGVFFLTAVTSIAAVVIICIFLFCNGVPAMAEIGFFDFVGGQKWAPTNVPASYGIFDMIIASIYVTAGAIIIGVPIGILTAVFLARFCPAPLYKVLKPATELLAGIPSIVYGFFGLMVVVPFIRDNFGGNGSSWLAASIVLGVMILPTIIGVSESAIRAVPESYYEGALALGATKERSVFKTILPASKSGVLAGVVLGIGRALAQPHDEAQPGYRLPHRDKPAVLSHGSEKGACQNGHLAWQIALPGHNADAAWRAVLPVFPAAGWFSR